MIIDGDPAVRALAAHHLEREGHRITRVADAMEAVAQFRGGTFDLVLLDMEMPGVGGASFARMLSDSPRLLGFASPPIVMMTARDEPGLMADSFDAGAAYFLKKPFTPREVSDVVRLVLAGTG